MKKHTVFNARFYRDMLRQLRLTGIAFSIVCVVISVLVPISLYLSRDVTGIQLSLSLDEATAVTPILWGFMYAGGALLVYNAFSFLNKRSASDFYHSMPNTALATWTSIAAAVATWIVGIVVGTVTVTMLTYTVLGLSIDWALFPYLVGYFTIGTLLVAAAAMIAMTVTGTTISNLAVTVLILFWPRLLLFMVSKAMESRMVIVPMEQLGLLNRAYHIPFGVFRQNPILFTGAYWYSGVLAIVYFAIAAMLYRVRRSETAEKSAPSRFLQHVYRCAAVLPLAIAPAALAVARRQSLFAYVRENPEEALLLWGVALVGYFVYELTTTKKIKNLLSTTPLFLVLTLISSLVVWIGAVALSDWELNRLPDASSLEKAQFLTSYHAEGLPNYGAILAGRESISDPAVLQKLHEVLSRNIREVKDDTIADDFYTSIQVKFFFKKEDLVYLLYFSEADIVQLQNLLMKNPAYMQHLRTLPENSHITYLSLENFSRSRLASANDVWRILKTELAALDDKAFLELVNSDRYPAVLVRGLVHGRNFTDRYALTPATPGAFNAYLEQNNAYSKDHFAQARLLVEAGKHNMAHLNITATFLNVPTLYNTQIFLHADPEEMGVVNSYNFTFEEFLSMVPETVPAEMDCTAPMVEISFEFFSTDYAEVYSGAVYLPLTQEQADAFTARIR